MVKYLLSQNDMQLLSESFKVVEISQSYSQDNLLVLSDYYTQGDIDNIINLTKGGYILDKYVISAYNLCHFLEPQNDFKPVWEKLLLEFIADDIRMFLKLPLSDILKRRDFSDNFMWWQDEILYVLPLYLEYIPPAKILKRVIISDDIGVIQGILQQEMVKHRLVTNSLTFPCIPYGTTPPTTIPDLVTAMINESFIFQYDKDNIWDNKAFVSKFSRYVLKTSELTGGDKKTLDVNIIDKIIVITGTETGVCVPMTHILHLYGYRHNKYSGKEDIILISDNYLLKYNTLIEIVNIDGTGLVVNSDQYVWDNIQTYVT